MNDERLLTVLKEPHISEKASATSNNYPQYAFIVAKDADKKEIKAAVEKQTKVTISGSDRGLVGQVAANIRAFRPPEPYKGKGVRYEGEFIQRKQGKAAGSK